MEINPIIVIGVPKDGDADPDAIEKNWRRATETDLGVVIINNDTQTSGVNKAEKAGAYVYVPSYASEQNLSNYETESGAERVARAFAESDRFYNHDVVIHVHALLPEMASAVIQSVMYPLADPHVRISTFVEPISEEEAQSKDIIKAKIEIHPTRRVHVLTNSQVAEVTAFSRDVADLGPPPYYKQIPIYAYRRGALDQFVRHGPTMREMDENIEPDRALEHGMRVGAVLLKDGLHADSPIAEKPTYTKSALNRMKEVQVVKIANAMGIDASVDDLKADTVAKILAAQAERGS